MPLADDEPVVAVNQDAIPRHQRIATALGEDVGFEQLELIGSQSRHPCLKLRIDDGSLYGASLGCVVGDLVGDFIGTHFGYRKKGNEFYESPSLIFGTPSEGALRAGLRNGASRLYTHAEPILSHALGRIITRFTRFTRFRLICL